MELHWIWINEEKVLYGRYRIIDREGLIFENTHLIMFTKYGFIKTKLPNHLRTFRFKINHDKSTRIDNDEFTYAR
jgi:hypothetical protein